MQVECLRLWGSLYTQMPEKNNPWVLEDCYLIPLFLVYLVGLSDSVGSCPLVAYVVIVLAREKPILHAVYRILPRYCFFHIHNRLTALDRFVREPWAREGGWCVRPGLKEAGDGWLHAAFRGLGPHGRPTPRRRE